MKELIEIHITIYPPGYRFQNEMWIVTDRYEGMWITPENYGVNGYNSRHLVGYADESCRELEEWEMEKNHFSPDYLKDMIFDRWGVRLEFYYPAYGIVVNGDHSHSIKDDVANVGQDEVFGQHIDRIFDIIDPYLLNLDERNVNRINCLTLWNSEYQSYSYFDGEEYDDNCHLELSLIGVVDNFVIRKI